MIMEDDVTYTKLREKLILLDKNTRAWSGDGFLRKPSAAAEPNTFKLYISRASADGSRPSAIWSEAAEASRKARPRARREVGLVFPIRPSRKARTKARANKAIGDMNVPTGAI